MTRSTLSSRSARSARRWHLIRDVRVADLGLGADDSLRDGGWGREESPRDLFGREPADFAQRQRDLRIGWQRRMAAREDEAQPVVFEAVILWLDRRLGGRLETLGQVRQATRRTGRDGARRRSP